MSFFGNLSSLFNAPSAKGSGKSVTPGSAKLQQPVAQIPQAKKPEPVVAKKPLAPQPVQPIQPAQLDESAAREAQARAKEIIVEAKDEALAIRSKAEQEARELRRSLEEQQRSLDIKLDRIETRWSQIEEKEKQLENQRGDIETAKKALEEERQKVLEKLEHVSGMTTDEARASLMDSLEKKLTKEMATLIRQKEQEAKAEADDRVREILVDAMKHGATDYVVE